MSYLGFLHYSSGGGTIIIGGVSMEADVAQPVLNADSGDIMLANMASEVLSADVETSLEAVNNQSQLEAVL